MDKSTRAVARTFLVETDPPSGTSGGLEGHKFLPPKM